MRLPLTFVLTVLLDDHNPGLFHGRVRSVATDEEITFSGPDELVALLRSEIVQVKPGPTLAASAQEGEAESME